ncbi:MAG: ankyrin repeat domain-containing protein [Desulfomonilaceae bacterium]
MALQYARILKVVIAVLFTTVSVVALLTGELVAQADDKDRDLILASIKGDLEQVKRLLDSGANVNAKDREGWTTLAWALRFRQWDVVKALLEKGAEVSGKARLSRRAVVEAAMDGRLEILRALLDQGLYVVTKSKEDYTALVENVREGNLAFIWRLLDEDTEVDAKEKPDKNEPPYQDDSTHDAKQHGASQAPDPATSKARFFGVDGWPYGIDCPGIELFWKSARAYATAYFETKKGKVLKLGNGKMAIFSPDCNCFWSTWYDGGVIEVFKTASGKRIYFFSGDYPAWSTDSSRIFMSRRGRDESKVYQLWEWSLINKEERKIVEVTDYCKCDPPEESIAWDPVEFKGNGDLIWSYSTCQEGANLRIWRILTVDPSSGKIKETETTERYCDTKIATPSDHED